MITLLVVAACLFVLGLLFGKRFGMLVLALAGGLAISQYLGETVTAVAGPYVNQYISYVPAALVLVPALVLLLIGKGRHRQLLSRAFNAAIFAVAGVVFLVAAPGTPTSISDTLPVIKDNLGLLITGLVALAVLELAFGKPSKKKVEEGK